MASSATTTLLPKPPPGPSASTSTSIQRPSSNSTTNANANGASSRAAAASSSMDAPTKKRKASDSAGGGGGGGVTKERLSSLGVDHSTDDDSASVTSRQVRDQKRTRVHFSCVECHRRKQKCDRKEPCSQCVARRVPHLCRPFLNGVEDPSNSDVSVRLNAIEGLLTRLVTSLPATMPTTTTSASSPDVLTLTASGEEIFHPRSAPSEPSKQSMPHKPPPSGQFPANISYSTPPGRSGFGWGLREGRLISLSIEENPELKEVISTLKESGISKNHLEWLIAGVPGRRMADGLVELYFRDIDWTRYKMNRPTFMRKYNAFFDSIGRNPSNPKVDADTLKWLPLCFIVLAIATLSAPHEIVPTNDQADWSRRFYGSARSGLEYAKALQRDNLDVLVAGLLASRYMLLTRRPAEGSTPLTTAFQLGLYRDGTVLNLNDKREVEIRRRAWAQLYHLDRTISLLVGRPASISDAHTDTRPPANLDDEELETDFDPAGHPMTKPTVYTYVIVRHKLAEIMGRIAYHTFAIQLPDYSTVLSLDKELLAWRESLPPFFSMSNPDTSLDADHSYLFVQRHLLACEWFYTRITLNRPYLLRRKPQDGRYGYSKDAAIESATADLLSRRSFIMEKGNLIVNSGGYRVLNSYMVLGVTIKLDPDSPQADKLRHLLNVVSGRAPDAQGRVSEPLVKEELAIVEFLTAKTNSSKLLSAPSDPSQRSSANEDQTPVDLLLNLAKTRSGRRAAEEEKRQLRLQTAREAQEKAAGGRANGMSSPWGYQVPQMPGLDVQQPFGNPLAFRAPRPLQPPPSRRSDNNNNNNGVNNNNNNNNGHNNNPSQWQPDTMFDSMNALQQPNFNTQSPDTVFTASPNTRRESILQNLSPYQAMAALPMQQQQQQQQQQNNGMPNLTADMFAGLPGVDSNMMVQGMQQQQQFGNAVMDGFDFNIGLAAAQPIDGTQFNPFALPQTEEGSGSEGMNADDETQFLNYILTKFANSQPEMQ